MTPDPDLFALLAALTALRQEVKLQTRAARHEREQAAQALEQLSGAVAQLDRLHQEAASRHQTEVQAASRAAVETLVELHDALSRAARQAGNMVASAVATLRSWSQWPEVWDRNQPDALRHTGAAADTSHGPPAADGAGPALEPGGRAWFLGWLGRLGRRAPVEPGPAAASAPAMGPGGIDLQAELHRMSSEAARLAERLEGLTAGYALSVQRLERALAACGIEPMVCLGQPVDAERMEVVQTVPDAAQPSGVVVEEVRRGYVQHGRVYRFAQVVATRSTQPADGESPATAVEGTPE
jgi:molecular chaperone GrpE (heat shock protein)